MGSTPSLVGVPCLLKRGKGKTWLIFYGGGGGGFISVEKQKLTMSVQSFNLLTLIKAQSSFSNNSTILFF